MCRHRVEITVKVKANMQFKKIFEVAEVLGAVHSVYAHALIIPLFSETIRQRTWCALPSKLAKHKSTDLDACRITQIRV